MKYPLWTLLLLARAALANPTGEQVVRGDALFIRPSNNELHIHQMNERAIVEWNDFSIDPNELTKFIQPSSESILLNRVVGQEISKIYGTLEANGQIVLINPHGVIVGKSGEIHAAAFLSSAYDLTNDDFFDGKLDFAPTDLRSAINIEGRIEATRVDRIDGRIFLVADEVNVSGELFASGGEIKLNGNHIALTQEGVLDASGLENGHGGRAIIFAEKSADFSGSIYAKGGSSSGDGGFIEVSSRGHLELTGHVSTMAPNGKPGMFLIDPTDVYISNSPDADYMGGPANITFNGPLVNINDVTLLGFLMGSPVTIDTSNITDQNQPGDITIDASAVLTNWVNPNSLTLKANRDIQVKADIGIIGTGVPGDFLAQAGRNITIIGAIYTDGSNISLKAGPLSGIAGFTSTGSVTLNNVLDTIQGVILGGSIDVEGYNITSTTTGVQHQTNTGNIEFIATNDISLHGFPDIALTDTGFIHIYAGRDVTVFPGSLTCQGFMGPFVGVQIDVRADFDLDGAGDLLFQGEPTTPAPSSWSTHSGGDIYLAGNNITLLGTQNSIAGNSDIFVDSSFSTGSLEIEARGNFTMQAGTGTGSATVIMQSGRDVLIRTGGDISLIGGSADGSAIADILSLGIPGTFCEFIAGGTIRLIGGTSVQIGDAAIPFPQIFFTAGEDIIFSAGIGSGGAAPINNAYILSQFEPAILKAGGSILCTNGPSNGMQTGWGGIFDLNTGCDVRAGGDIQFARSNHGDSGFSIYIEADANIPNLWTAQSGSYLTNTVLASARNVVSDGLGGYRTFTAPEPGGIVLGTIDAPITLYSAARFLDGTAADIIFDNITTTNATRILSMDANIQIAAFHNIDINNTINTRGAILVAADNTMNINAPAGFIRAGGPITLIVDQQSPTTAGTGFFNNYNSGVFTTDPDQRIAIYAASGPAPPVGFNFPDQVVLGNLDSVMTWDSSKPLGLLSKYGTSYQNGGPFHGGGFGASYVAGNGVFSSPVIWYKIFATLTATTDEALFSLQEIRNLIPERLWVQEFSLLVDRAGLDKQVQIMMDHKRREATIQSRYAIASSKDYFIRSTMSGDFIRLLDRYQEFEESPFWRTPDVIDTLNWLEGVQ